MQQKHQQHQQQKRKGQEDEKGKIHKMAASARLTRSVDFARSFLLSSNQSLAHSLLHASAATSLREQ